MSAVAAGMKVGENCTLGPMYLDVILPDETQTIRVPLQSDMVNQVCGWYYPQIGPFYAAS